MKKIFIAGLIACSGAINPQVLTAQQKKAVYVQGHLHEYLTSKAANGQLQHRRSKVTDFTTDSIDFSTVECWAGGLDPANVHPIDSAVLVVKWTDAKAIERGDSILIFGFHWNSTDTSGLYAKTVYTIDMIRAIANTSCRFSALLQNTGGGNYTVGGFGYNSSGGTDGQVPLVFRESDAQADTTVKFQYSGDPNCAVGQLIVPYSVDALVQAALDKADGAGDATIGTGIIDHPFNADYGYPAYDYDYWVLGAYSRFYEWQAGWTSGNWSFYTKNQPMGQFVYSDYSITSRQLGKGYVDGFVFNTDPLAWPPAFDMSGTYTSYECECGCLDTAPSKTKRK
jgi:hypothetical protein